MRYIYIYTLLETNMAPGKWMVGMLVSFWDSLFSGAMLVSGRVCIGLQHSIRKIPTNQSHYNGT